MQMESVLDLVSADDDFVMCQNAPYGQVFVLPSRRLVHPASDDAFVTLRQTDLNITKLFSIKNFIVLSKLALEIFLPDNLGLT